MQGGRSLGLCNPDFDRVGHFSFKVPVCHNSLPYLSTKKASLGAEGSIGDWSCSTGAEETGESRGYWVEEDKVLIFSFVQEMDGGWQQVQSSFYQTKCARPSFFSAQDEH
mmetsp:Transcript_32375/g.56383  ORF Transcript_32375/g.56383 Transcript_32375/m.56383 type:complete len:110 (-) Transcript_32375:313-642(-)